LKYITVNLPTSLANSHTQPSGVDLALINITPNFTPLKLDKCTQIYYIIYVMSKKPIKDRATGIRIPQQWHTELYRIAAEECRSLNSVVNQAIKQYLEKRRGKK